MFSEDEKKLHIEVIEDNLTYWMFESGYPETYSKEICSAILLLEKLSDADYKFSEVWGPNDYTIDELKKKYLTTLESMLNEENTCVAYDTQTAYDFARKYLEVKAA